MSAHREVPIEFYRGARITLLVTSGIFKADSGRAAEPLKETTLEALRKKIDASVPEGLLPAPFDALTVTHSVHDVPTRVKVLGVRIGKAGPLLVFEKPDGTQGLATELVESAPEIENALRERAAAFADYQVADSRWRASQANVEGVQKLLTFGPTGVRGIAERNSQGGQTP